MKNSLREKQFQWVNFDEEPVDYDKQIKSELDERFGPDYGNFDLNTKHHIIQKKVKPFFDNMRSKDISSDEVNSIKAYSKGFDQEINNNLRNDSDGSKIISNHIKNIDSAIEKSTLPHSIILHRYISGVTPEDFSDITPGSVMEHKGYVSTSLHSLDESSDHSIQMRITAPKGANGIGMGYQDDLTHYPKESEVLLPRKSKIKITKIDHYLHHWGEPAMKIHGILMNGENENG